MVMLPQIVSEAWDARKGPVVLSTVDAKGVPNSIYATCVKKFSEDQMVIADNYFNKTRANILAGSQGSLLFITEAGKAYQIKGRLEYMTAGDIFADMKCWNDPKHPGNAAVVLHVEQVFSGGTQLI